VEEGDIAAAVVVVVVRRRTAALSVVLPAMVSAVVSCCVWMVYVVTTDTVHKMCSCIQLLHGRIRIGPAPMTVRIRARGRLLIVSRRGTFVNPESPILVCSVLSIPPPGIVIVL
jgi:uncharacterized protein with PQ loop repeat